MKQIDDDGGNKKGSEGTTHEDSFECNNSREEIDDVESENSESNGDPDFIPETDESEDENDITDTQTSNDTNEYKELDDPDGEKEFDPTIKMINDIHDRLACRLPVIVDNTDEESDDDISRKPLNEDEMICDSSNNKVYIKAYKKSMLKNVGKRKKSNRPYDCVHSCLFCDKLYTNIQSHLEHKHRDKAQIKELNEMRTLAVECDETDKKEVLVKIKKNQSLLRFEGDHLLNQKVLQIQKGQFILARRPSNTKTFNVDDYGPCPECHAWIRLDTTLKKHQEICPTEVENNKSISFKSLRCASMALVKGKLTIGTALLQKEVLPSMKNDAVKDLVQKDVLIICLGDTWLAKSIDNKTKRKNIASFRMRLAARLLKVLREEEKEANSDEMFMLDFLTPQHFDNIAKAALLTCSTDENEELAHPSTAVKLGFDVARMAQNKLCIGIKAKNKTFKEDAIEFLSLMKHQWSEMVNKQARSLLSARHRVKTVKLPKPDDIKTLNLHVVKEVKKAELTPANFRNVAILVQARLLLYNKRRSGELENVSLDDYTRHSQGVDEVDMSLLGKLSPLENYLFESQEMMSVRGNLEHTVPVLLPEDVQQPLCFLACPRVRAAAHIKKGNRYLFPTTGDYPFRAYDSLKTMCESVGISSDNITPITLRKYTATLTHMLDLSDHQVEWVCKHLGHTKGIHKQVYRQLAGSVERIQIGKLMLIQDYGLGGKFVNKTLESVQFEDIIQAGEEETENCVPAEQSPKTVKQQSFEAFLDADCGDDIPKRKQKFKWSQVDRQRSNGTTSLFQQQT